MQPMHGKEEAGLKLSVDDVAEGVGLKKPRSALLYACPKCNQWNVVVVRNTTIQRNFTEGSLKAKLTVGKAQACASCGSFGFRLHSTRQSRIVAMVDASKSNQVRNLRAVAEELNVLQDETGEMATEHDANRAWFAMNRNLVQGAGKKYWGLPFRRWTTNVTRGWLL